MTTDEMKEFISDRKNALLSMDKKIIQEYARKYEIDLPSDEITFWCAVHKARTACTDLSYHHRMKSEQWLIENGFKPAICE